MTDCIFCKIVKGEIPSYKVFEDESFVAFLSIEPHKIGHTLIIPKEHIDYYFDLPKETLINLVPVQKKLANAIKKALTPKSGKIGLVVAGLEMPHAHLHLIPLDDINDLNFGNTISGVTNEEFLQTQEKIKQALD